MQETDSPSKRFEDLVRRILAATGFTLTPYSRPLSIGGFDFTAEWDDAGWAIEVKYYRTARAQMSLIESAAARLIHRDAAELQRYPILVVSSEISDRSKDALEAKYAFALIDRSNLYSLAKKHPELISELDFLLEIKSTDTSTHQAESTEVVFNKVSAPGAGAVEEDTRGTELSDRLIALSPGRETYRDHEDLCVEIIKYLFADALFGFREQQKTDDDMSRFDLVCRLIPGKDFWDFLISHMNSRYVIFEFKNYQDKIKQGQILTTEKYLLEKALRRAAVIISRKGADENAKRTAQGAMREHGKLILVLDDENICQMLLMKERGEDPTDALFGWADDFMLSLPR